MRGWYCNRPLWSFYIKEQRLIIGRRGTQEPDQNAPQQHVPVRDPGCIMAAAIFLSATAAPIIGELAQSLERAK